ncbi:hypothetical protein MOD96_01660 [Bacillus sp. S17B2]|uniref:hypothetical protein n=1 Tax=Bacillus sp. S17B2 TaxID=2918907 RepID=UPI0022804772|nr:hypothetical protein [Bacillus sp. S17B2]
MIIVITEAVRDKKTGLSETIVSHGYDIRTGKPVILPQVNIDEIDGAVFDRQIGEYVIY